MTGGQPTTPAIELSGVGVFRDSRWILRNVEWRVPTGDCVAVLGPNGSGKSTLTRVIGCHLWPSAGNVRILGTAFGGGDLSAVRQQIRLVQAAGPYDVETELTAIEVVYTGFFSTLGLYHVPNDDQRALAEALLASVGLSRVASHTYATLSSGERVRALIARALAAKPKLLLLDEPTAGLDLLAREQVLATVNQLHASRASDRPTIVMNTHHIEELPPSVSQILLLSNGEVDAQGSPDQVLKSETLSKVYGVPLTVDQRHGRYYVHVPPTSWEGLLKP
jgi:iron complex transport system ATP-binding protein